MLDSHWRSLNINDAGRGRRRPIRGNGRGRIPNQNPVTAADDEDFYRAESLSIEAAEVKFLAVGFGIGTCCVRRPAKKSLA